MTGNPPKTQRSKTTRFHRWMAWLLKKRDQGPDLGHRLALVLSFLVAGILALANLDRTLHAAGSAKIGFQASQHGWPMVYLNRTFDESTPNHLRQTRRFDWPYPPVDGEIRKLAWGNLLIDGLAAAAIIASVYSVVRRLTGWSG